MTLQDSNQPFHKDQPRLNNFETAEKAAIAQALLDNPVIQDALIAIYSKAAGTLLTTDPGTLTATSAHAMMKSVIDLQNQLKEYVSDDKVRQKYNKGDV